MGANRYGPLRLDAMNLMQDMREEAEDFVNYYHFQLEKDAQG